MSKHYFQIFAFLSISLISYSPVIFADDGDNSVVNRAFNFFNDPGWAQFADDDAHIGPGGGGQRFDAEYLYYKYNKTTKDLTIGLQTGFDVYDGNYNGYYAGDLALSFDGSTSGPLNGYEYAVDFGLVTKDYYGSDPVNIGINNSGQDAAGLYSVTSWNNDILNSTSSPFAMDEGNLIAGALSENTSTDYASVNSSGYAFSDNYNNAGIDSSFYRVVTFNLAGVVDTSANFTVDAHWTMSCGNDAINGGFDVTGYTPPGGGTPVSEPSILALFSLGSLSLGFMGYRRRKMTEEGAFMA